MSSLLAEAQKKTKISFFFNKEVNHGLQQASQTFTRKLLLKSVKEKQCLLVNESVFASSVFLTSNNFS